MNLMSMAMPAPVAPAAEEVVAPVEEAATEEEAAPADEGASEEAAILEEEVAPVEATPAPEDTTAVLDVLGPEWGGMGKGFIYYTFEYAGDGSTVTVELNYAPNGAVAQSGVHVKVFAPDETVAAEMRGGDFGMTSASFSSAVAGTYTIEVANYNDAQLIDYGLVVKGAGASDLMVK